MHHPAPAFAMPQAVIGLVVLAALACGGGPAVRIVEAGGDDRCSTVFNYCLTARCSLENTSRRPITVRLSYLVSQADGRADKYTETVTLDADELRVFNHDFKSAGLLGGRAQVECRID